MSTIASLGPVSTTQPPSLLTIDPDRAAGRSLDPEARQELLLGRLVERLTQSRGEYGLDDWFTPLVAADDVAYRHEVFTDLETPAVRYLAGHAAALGRSAGVGDLGRRLRQLDQVRGPRCRVDRAACSV